MVGPAQAVSTRLGLHPLAGPLSILILDEAVSNLDAENEEALQAAIRAVRRGRTTLLIAHRFSTIRSADRIVVLRDGRAVEQGTDEELRCAGGEYARLLHHQAMG
ncbi:hypothetical protein [Micromonospora sp. CPCC 206061]|uniref:hypothetical protein n=1 Tax=Micromonospora sp. CPCC 206061 TaxID=3122410 RepID=UPI002FF33751